MQSRKTDPAKPVYRFLGVDSEKAKPPFYQFDAITMMYCRRRYKLDLKSLDWSIGEIEGSTTICPPGSEISDEQAYEWIVGNLEEYDFDVSTLANGNARH